MRALIILLALTLAACVTNRGLHVAEGEQIAPMINYAAADAVAQIVRHYPTSTKFKFYGKDSFGESIESRLRKQGFDLDAKPGEQSKKLEYVLDGLGNKMYRVSLFIDSRTMSRLYVNNSPIQKVGAWSVGGKDGK